MDAVKREQVASRSAVIHGNRHPAGYYISLRVMRFDGISTR